MTSATWVNITDPTWRGNSRAIKYVLPVLFLSSLTCFAISLSMFIDLRTWPLDSYYAKRPNSRPSEAILFLYTSAMPLATTLASLTDILLHRSARLYPTASILWSIATFTVWWYILPVLWGTCEFSSDTIDGESCPKFYVYDEGMAGHGQIWGSGSGGWRFYCRILFGCGAAVGAVVQLSLAGLAIDLGRKEGRARRVKDGERVELGERL